MVKSQINSLDLPKQISIKLRKALSYSISFPLFVYFAGVMLSTPYYNWQYAKQNGFVSWLFLGEIRATLKAGAWPLYAFESDKKSEWSAEERSNATSFFLSFDIYQKVLKDSNEPAFIENISSNMPLALTKLKSALNESKTVRDDVLEKMVPGMSKSWRDLYQKGLELQIQGWETKDRDMIKRSNALINDWGQWYNSNLSKFKMPT